MGLSQTSNSQRSRASGPVTMQDSFPGLYRKLLSTVEALVSGHPWDTEKVSVTGAGRLREWFS